MQASESGNSNQSDDGITFRPSPNFKHMKKYLKSKFEEDQNEENNRLNNSSVQPPLPPNSPPPDCPITMKQEIEDDEYERALSGGRSPGAEPEEASAGAEPAAAGPEAPGALAADGAGGADFTMCKDWVRGTCTRGAACIYVHKLDKSQLRGVYRFCRDFANARCERPVCYFVHATTFEKEHYYRTAYLPPRATQHLKSPAPPLAPASIRGFTPEGAAPPLVPPMFGHPRPVAVSSAAAAPVVPVMPVMPPTPEAAAAGGVAVPVAGAGGPVVVGAGGAGGAGGTGAGGPGGAAPAGFYKRGWRGQDDLGGAAPEAAGDGPLAKRCRMCDLFSLRLQTTNAELEVGSSQMKQLDAQVDVVLKNCEYLQRVLTSLLKPRRHGNGNALRKALGACNRLPKFCADSDEDALLAQERAIMSPNEQVGKMRMLLAKILFGTDPDGRENERKPGREP